MDSGEAGRIAEQITRTIPAEIAVVTQVSLSPTTDGWEIIVEESSLNEGGQVSKVCIQSIRDWISLQLDWQTRADNLRDRRIKRVIKDTISYWQETGKLQLVALHREWGVTMIALRPDIAPLVQAGKISIEQLKTWMNEAIRQQVADH